MPRLRETLTKKQFADLCGISGPSLLQAIKAGRIRVNDDGRIPDPGAQARTFANKADPHAPAKSYQHFRSLSEKYKALMSRLDYQQQLGELVLRSDAEGALDDATIRFKQHLETLPARSAALLLGVTDLDEMRMRLKKIVDEIISDANRQATELLKELEPTPAQRAAAARAREEFPPDERTDHDHHDKNRN